MARSHRSSKRERSSPAGAPAPAADEAAFLDDYDPWWRQGPVPQDRPSDLVYVRSGETPTMVDLSYDDWEGYGYHVTYA